MDRRIIAVLILGCALILGCSGCGIFKHERTVNAYLQDNKLIWPPNKTKGDITLKGKFRERLELEKILDGDYYNYVYKVTYNNLEILNGKWKDPEISFLYKHRWPTQESGIKYKALSCPFRENDYLIFEIKKSIGKNIIIGYKRIEENLQQLNPPPQSSS